MIHQPVEIKETLVDDVLGTVALVFDDDGVAVLIDTERIHPPAVGGHIFGRQEANTEQRFEVLFKEGLQGLFQGRRGSTEFGQRTAALMKQLDVTHADFLFRLRFGITVFSALMRARSSLAGSSDGSCGTRRPEKASFRMD